MIRWLKRLDYVRTIWAWAMYDWANSAFATTVMAAVLPNFYSQVAAGNLTPTLASSYWGYTNTLAMALIAFLAPVLGAMADYLSSKKRFLGIFLGTGVLFTGLLSSIAHGQYLQASLFYICARVGFGGANIFYDALLVDIAPREKMDEVSSFGFALGYLGGGLLLALNLWMIINPQVWGLSDAVQAAQFSFLTVAVWWAVFSIPLFLWVKEQRQSTSPGAKFNPVREGIHRVWNTLQHVRQYRQLFRFIIAFWFYNDGIGTIIIMAVIFGTEIGIDSHTLIGAILLVQFVGVPFAILFGKLAGKIGTKRAILLGLAVYLGISVGGYFLYSALHFWILAIMVAMVQGGTQALSRSLYASMVPAAKAAEFFGFYDLSQKFSGFLGPAVFGLVAQLFDNSRISILSLIIFFVVGGLLLLRVDEQEGRATAQL